MSTEGAPTTQSQPVRQFSVMLENRIGALHSMMNLLSDCGVFALGFSVQDSFDVTILRLVASDPESLETFFMERGISHSVHEVVVVEMPGGPSSISKCLSALHQGETNIYISYPLLVRPNGHALLALAVDDPHFACSALSNQGFKLLFEDDLSR